MIQHEPNLDPPSGHDYEFPEPTMWSKRASYTWDVDVDVPGRYEGDYGCHVTSVSVSIEDSPDNDPDYDDGLYVQENTTGWRLKKDGTRDRRATETRWLYWDGWVEFVKPYKREALRLWKEQT